MRSMILAAGYGTSLWPLTIDRAKPAIPFMGRPLVGYVAEYLARFGFKEIVVNLHHRPESVRDALGDGRRFGVRFHYIEEPSILGTGGALDNARGLLDADTFVVVNGKIATDVNLEDALRTHRRTGALATLVLRANAARERYSKVLVSEGLVAGFGASPASDNVGDNQIDNQVPLMFTGIQILDPRIFEYIPRGVFSHTVTDTFIPAIARGERIAAHVAEGFWYELSTVRRYLETSVALMKREARDVEVGAGTSISESAGVVESVLWENVRLSAGASGQRSILGARVVVR